MIIGILENKKKKKDSFARKKYFISMSWDGDWEVGWEKDLFR